MKTDDRDSCSSHRPFARVEAQHIVVQNIWSIHVRVRKADARDFSERPLANSNENKLHIPGTSLGSRIEVYGGPRCGLAPSLSPSLPWSG